MVRWRAAIERVAGLKSGWPQSGWRRRSAPHELWRLTQPNATPPRPGSSASARNHDFELATGQVTEAFLEPSPAPAGDFQTHFRAPGPRRAPKHHQHSAPLTGPCLQLASFGLAGTARRPEGHHVETFEQGCNHRCPLAPRARDQPQSREVDAVLGRRNQAEVGHPHDGAPRPAARRAGQEGKRERRCPEPRSNGHGATPLEPAFWKKVSQVGT
jgi:hypothetical protein